MYKFQRAVTYPEGENEVEGRGPQLYLKYLIFSEYFKNTQRKKRNKPQGRETLNQRMQPFLIFLALS